MRKFTRELTRRALRLASEERLSRATDRLPTFHELRPLFERELRRARRYERPFSILVLGFARTLEPAQRAHRLAQLGSLLQDRLRETDLVGYLADSGEFAALLPEADASTVVQGAERIRQLWMAGDAVNLVAGAATYPADGLTLDDLLTCARRSTVAVAVGLTAPFLQTGSVGGA